MPSITFALEARQGEAPDPSLTMPNINNTAITQSNGCPTCLIGAASTTLYSFPFYIQRTITATVVPAVTFYHNGSIGSGYTRLPTDDSEDLDAAPSIVFSRTEDMVWFVNGVTLWVILC